MKINMHRKTETSTEDSVFLITAEVLPIHLHIRGQSKHAALMKLKPCNVQLLNSGKNTHTDTHTHLYTVVPACFPAWAFEFNVESLKQSV